MARFYGGVSSGGSGGSGGVVDVNSVIAQIVEQSPSTIQALNLLAAALEEDQNLSTTILNQLGEKASTGKAIAMSIVFGG